MPLPPVKLPESVLLEIYRDLLQGPARRFGDAWVVFADRILAGRTKSREERDLDYLKGEVASENRRRLAAEALDRVLPERRIFPAPQIAGPIFRGIEFELPGTPIWEMWRELLARASDRDRVGEAHPSFSWIITQLSSDEARLLTALGKIQPNPEPGTNVFASVETPKIGVVFQENVYFYISHLGSLGLLITPTGFDPEQYRVVIDGMWTYMLTDFARSFMSAVSPESVSAPDQGS